MKERTQFENLNRALSEHSAASGYEPVKKDDGSASSDGASGHSASARQTLSVHQAKPSSRSAFNSAHSQSTAGAFKKPLAPQPPAAPAKPMKPLQPLKPLKPVGAG
jgi:hypothetical protein